MKESSHKGGASIWGGRRNILKHQPIHVAGFNLSLIIRQRLGKGTPRAWQGFTADLWLAFCASGSRCWPIWSGFARRSYLHGRMSLTSSCSWHGPKKLTSATGC